MYEAEVADDVYGDDPTINRLDGMAAKRTGKEAAMFVPSGTMGNQICSPTHTQPGDEIITTPYAHLFHDECGVPARPAHVSCAMTDLPCRMIAPDDIENLIRPERIPIFRIPVFCVLKMPCVMVTQCLWSKCEPYMRLRMDMGFACIWMVRVCLMRLLH